MLTEVEKCWSLWTLLQQSDLRYPEARIVGTTAAQDKLLAAQALPRNLATIDYDLELNQVCFVTAVHV